VDREIFPVRADDLEFIRHKRSADLPSFTELEKKTFALCLIVIAYF